MQKQYEKLMRKCISLAKKYAGKTSPNPLVGAIIFDDNFNIISMGAHQKYGEYHAERNAILSTKENLKDKNLIVNLEPCSHYGKTPPCADLIIEKGIKKVIIGSVDPNPIVAGNGIKKLKEAGIEVIVDVKDGVSIQDAKNLGTPIVFAFTEEERAYYKELAASYNLITTGGTDYHGPEVKPNIELGTGINNNVQIDKNTITLVDLIPSRY